MNRANRELHKAKGSYDFIIAPKSRSIAETKKNTFISNRKKESAQIRVNQVSTAISKITNKIEFKRIDVSSVTARNGVMHSRLQDKETMLRTLRSGAAESRLRSSKHGSPGTMVNNWNTSMMSARQAFHSQSETRANLGKTIDMVKEMHGNRSFLSSLVEIPTTIIRNTEDAHLEGMELMSSQIKTYQDANSQKVSSVITYVELMQNLDSYISSVINSSENSGDIQGTINVLSQAVQETNDKIALLSFLEGDVHYYENQLEKTRLEMKTNIQKCRNFDVQAIEGKIRKEYFAKMLEDKRIK